MPLHSKINDEEPGSILNSMAKALNAKIKQNLNECVLEIPENHGKGEIRLMSFSQGISIMSIHLNLKNSFELVYNDGIVHPLKIILLKNGSIKHAFKNTNKETKINKFECVIIASTPDNNHYFKISRNKDVTMLSIQINRKLFENKIEDFIPSMHRNLSKIFRDVNGIQEFFYKNFYNQESLKIIDDILTNTGKDFIESIIVEGQTYQLMMLQLKQYLVNQKSPEVSTTLASKSRLKLSQAIDFIENNIEDYTTVKDLAKQIDINEKTLQSAFKQFYNCTVNTYVRNFRAHHARMLVETTDLSISEIAYKVGLSSPNHLTKLFKLYYGVSPTEHKRKTKEAKNI
ncbi:helix-turn-helix transcriptional regulator [Winogradskyella litorisediminis]|uniref:Helix-turn-helix transcriptional regulator n=1 Tax=Winogradskyella litorisediminis TaxID=1156618 RepID=A0ABW3N6M2_9FLAO